MEPDESVHLLREVKTTLETIRQILEIQSRPALLAEINALASTTERRKMWILSDGDLKTPELAPKAGLKLRAAQYFVEEGTRAGLLALENRNCPKRTIDLVPEDWKEIKELEAKTSPPSNSTASTEPHQNGGGVSNGQH